MKQKKWKVLIADDEPSNLDALELAFSAIPNTKVCGKALGGHQLLEAARALQPDIIVTDIRMPDLNGIEATRILRGEGITAKIIALTQYRQEKQINEMLKAGADGYLMKDADSRRLEAAIHAIMNGTPYLCEETNAIMHRLLQDGRIDILEAPKPGFFSPQQQRVLYYICSGLSSKQIASEMKLSYFTIVDYRRELYRKSGSGTEVEFVVFATANGYYRPGQAPPPAPNTPD